MSESCEKMEVLISKVMDGECSPQERKALKSHLAECLRCRETIRAFGRVDSLLESGKDLPAPPSCPKISEPGVSSRFPKAAFLAAAAAVAAFAFLGGAWWGQQKAIRSLPPSYSRVASAALWEKAPDPLRREAALAALPLSEAVTGYQREVARLLRQKDVDWERVRRLVEAIGALRTDMELLTLHVAFIEKEQGKTDPASAAWLDLLGLDDRGGSL
ncbi:MAG TPA: zf-HC2 domain-containing protein [Synergistales bacterium]|nr:zf-HC2 domain-containing protein [Synergistales bacterium]